MSSYQPRLDRIEAAIAPQNQLISLLVKDGQTNEDVLREYADARGIKAADIRVPIVYVSEIESVL